MDAQEPDDEEILAEAVAGGLDLAALPLALLVPRTTEKLTTLREPRMLFGGRVLPVPEGDSFSYLYTGTWAWFLAGRICVSSFEFSPSTPLKERVRLATEARDKLIAFVHERLAFGGDGALAVIKDGGAIPRAPRKEP